MTLSVVEVRVETRQEVSLLAVDNTQLVRVTLNLIKSLGIEKEILKSLRGY